MYMYIYIIRMIISLGINSVIVSGAMEMSR